MVSGHVDDDYSPELRELVSRLANGYGRIQAQVHVTEKAKARGPSTAVK